MADIARYRQVVERMARKGDIRWTDYLEHIALQNERLPAGPAIGAVLDVPALRDQHGQGRSLAELSGPHGLLLVFVRSVHWCGYCRNQLAELEMAAAKLRKAGIGLAAVSSDPPERIAAYARERVPSFPVLADPEARFIEDVGLLNPAAEGVAFQNGGRIACPAQILLSPDGQVLDVVVSQDIRHRPSATVMAMRHSEQDARPSANLVYGPLTASVFASTERVFGGQEFAVRATVEIPDGWLIYAADEDGAFAAPSLAFDCEVLDGQEVTVSEPRAEFLPDFGRILAVHRGRLEFEASLRVRWSPPVQGSAMLRGIEEELAERQIAPGRYPLRGSLGFQACGGGECHLPQKFVFELPLVVAPDAASVEVLDFGLSPQAGMPGRSA